MSKLRVAMIAPPWLALPAKGYGGIELVLEGLIAGLKTLDVDVEVFASGPRKFKGVKTHSLYKDEQYEYVGTPLYYSSPIILAHIQSAINQIKSDGKFDIIHDHNSFFGPVMLAMATSQAGMPPALHTLHGPPFSTKETIMQGLPDNRPMYEQLKDPGKLYFVSISNTLMRGAPKEVLDRTLPAVYNAIDLDFFPYLSKKKNYYITLARFTPDKGQDIAVKAAIKLNKRLKMAGNVAGINSNKKLMLELSNPQSPYRNNADFRYYSDQILPYVVEHKNITYSGNLSGPAKTKFISEAKALLFPIQWEEPFGMAVIEALACGTPVVAMKRGAMPEIIEHGVNGFLAESEEEFLEYMQRVGEIDPANCRRSVEAKFSVKTMAKSYLDRYEEAIRLSSEPNSREVA